MEGSSWQDLEIKDWSIYNELQLGPVQLLTIEKVLEQLLDLGNPSRTSNQNDVIDGAFVQFIGTFIIKVAENLKLLS